MNLIKKIYDFENKEELIYALENDKNVYVKQQCSLSGAFTPYQKVTVDLENQQIYFEFKEPKGGDFKTANISFEKLDFNNYEMAERIYE